MTWTKQPSGNWSTTCSRGEVSADDAVAALRRLPFADLGFARVDHHRALRQGRAETVYAPGKTPSQCTAIVAELLAQPGSSPVILSRAADDQVEAATGANPGGSVVPAGDGDPDARPLHTVVWRPAPARGERVVVVTAGTADLPVADECAATLVAHGARPACASPTSGWPACTGSSTPPTRSPPPRPWSWSPGWRAPSPAWSPGSPPAPVVAVPTSVGYGAALEGVTALLGMLASCASGLTVVGIDNGFGAACAVLRTLDAARSEQARA